MILYPGFRIDQKVLSASEKAMEILKQNGYSVVE